MDKSIHTLKEENAKMRSALQWIADHEETEHGVVDLALLHAVSRSSKVPYLRTYADGIRIDRRVDASTRRGEGRPRARAIAALLRDLDAQAYAIPEGA